MIHCPIKTSLQSLSKVIFLTFILSIIGIIVCKIIIIVLHMFMHMFSFLLESDLSDLVIWDLFRNVGEKLPRSFTEWVYAVN